MITRSGKKTQREGPASEDRSPDSSPKRIKRTASEAELEQELAHPSKQDYKRLRNALIAARAESRSKEDELEAIKRELEDRDRESRKQEQQPSSLRIRGIPEPVPRETSDREGQDDPRPNDPRPWDAMLNRLRSEIRNFSKKYFGNELQHPSYVEIAPGWPAEVMQATTPGEDTFVDYLLSRRRCPLIIRAFIWRYLTGIVFNGALWGDNNRIRKHFSGLQRALSKFYTQQHAKPERIRRYQQWKQATTKLALELHEIPPIDPRFDTMARRHATAISKVLTPFMRTDPGGHMDSLVEIINQAIELDREISQQLPLITWAFKPRPSEATFPGSAEPTFNFSRDQGNIMKLQRGESMPTRVAEGGEAKVYLVVAPGLTQRGEDNGQATSFGEEVWIEKMHVSCVEPRMQATFGPRNGGYAIQS